MSAKTRNGTWVPQPDSTAGRARAMCASPQGATLQEVADAGFATKHVVNCRMADMVKVELLFRAGLGRDQRYFMRREDRDAWAAVEVPKMVAARAEKRREVWRRNSRTRDARRVAAGIVRPRKRAEPKPPRPVVEKPARAPTLRRQLVEACRHENGMSPADLAAAFRRSTSSLSAHLVALLHDGRLHRVGTKGKHARYFADEARAAAYGAARVAEAQRREYARQRPVPARPSVAAPVVIKPPARSKWDGIEPTVPPGLVVQVLPGCRVEDRFRPDPSIAGRGAISQDWYERRLKGAQG